MKNLRSIALLLLYAIVSTIFPKNFVRTFEKLDEIRGGVGAGLDPILLLLLGQIFLDFFFAVPLPFFFGFVVADNLQLRPTQQRTAIVCQCKSSVLLH